MPITIMVGCEAQMCFEKQNKSTAFFLRFKSQHKHKAYHRSLDSIVPVGVEGCVQRDEEHILGVHEMVPP